MKTLLSLATMLVVLSTQQQVRAQDCQTDYQIYLNLNNSNPEGIDCELKLPEAVELAYLSKYTSATIDKGSVIIDTFIKTMVDKTILRNRTILYKSLNQLK